MGIRTPDFLGDSTLKVWCSTNWAMEDSRERRELKQIINMTYFRCLLLFYLVKKIFQNLIFYHTK